MERSGFLSRLRFYIARIGLRFVSATSADLRGTEERNLSQCHSVSLNVHGYLAVCPVLTAVVLCGTQSHMSGVMCIERLKAIILDNLVRHDRMNEFG